MHLAVEQNKRRVLMGWQLAHVLAQLNARHHGHLLIDNPRSKLPFSHA